MVERRTTIEFTGVDEGTATWFDMVDSVKRFLVDELGLSIRDYGATGKPPAVPRQAKPQQPSYPTKGDK